MQPKFKIGDIVNIRSDTYPDGIIKEVLPSTIFSGHFSYHVQWKDGYGFSRSPWEEYQLFLKSNHEQEFFEITEIIRAIP